MKPVILVVDDDESILKSVKRLLCRHDYDVRLASTGEEAVRILGETAAAVVICDQRMPVMPGAQILAEAAKLRPDAFRITLTGHTDLKAAQQSINEGQVDYFLLKPWDDDVLLAAVHQGVQSYEAVQEKHRLEALIRQQKAELEAWNQQLEEKVRLRTEELQEQNANLSDLRGRLAGSLRDTVAMLASMLEAYSPSLGIHSKRVAALCRALGERLELPLEDLCNLEFAAYLHDLGKMSKIYSSEAWQRTSTRKGRDERTVHHADLGAGILSHVSGFEDVALAIRHQHERYDGQGHPDGLHGEEVPLASRILAVVNAYDEGVYSTSSPTSIRREAGRRILSESAGSRFDPKVVAALLSYMDELEQEPKADTEVELSPKQIRKGMTLARDITNTDGLLLLKKGSCLTSEMIGRIRHLADVNPLLTSVFIRCDTEEEKRTCQVPLDLSKSKQAPGATTNSGEKIATSGRSCRVLIVDDDGLVCNALARELRQAGWQTKSVNNGRDAQNLLEEETFDVLVVDVAMPVMSGDLLLAHVQQCWPDLPCVVLTGHATRQVQNRLSMIPNVVRILSKPWDQGELISVIGDAAANGIGSEDERRRKRTLSQPSSGSESSSAWTATAQGKGRALIVDDSRLIRNALSRELHREGISTAAASTGMEALSLVQQEAFDVAILDLAMSPMTGAELIGRLQQCAPDLPCIILSGKLGRAEILKLPEEPNVRGILAKPWDHDRLIATVNDALSARHAGATGESV